MNNCADGAPRVIELDQSSRCDRQRYSYTRIVRIGGHRVRARIERDFYPFQSRAVAEVLARDMTWTHLADDDPRTGSTPPPRPATARSIAPPNSATSPTP